MNEEVKVTQDNGLEKIPTIVPGSECRVREADGEDASKPVLLDKAKSQLAVWTACLELKQ
jgi:hypothetical protein